MKIIASGKRVKDKFTKITLLATAGLLLIGGLSVTFGGLFVKAAPNLNGKYQYIDTNYSIPSSNVKFVDINGNDGNLGTQAAPYKTLQKAIDASADGGTIVMNAGIYRQGHVGSSRSLTIQAAPHAEVWLKGSRVVDSWVQDGANWVSSGWAPEFCNTCTVNPDSSKEGMAAYPAQVFIDEEPMTQVASQAEVSSGKFYIDTVAKKIVIGSNPTGKTIEASDSPRGLTVATSGSFNLLGINFAQYSPQQAFAKSGQPYNVGPSQIYIDSVSSSLIENSVIVQSANGGIAFGSSNNVTIKNTNFYDNGGGALAINQSSNIVITDNKFERGNAAGFNVDSCGSYCTVGNLKITHSENINIKNNLFTDTNSVGIWCDEGCINTNIINNFVSNHRRGAIMYEVSSKSIIAGNIVESSKYGIEVGGSDHVKIYNNTLSRNERNMRVYEDKRVNGCNSYNNTTHTCTSPENWSISKGLSWNTTDVEMHNNIMSRSKRADNTNSYSVFMALSAVQEDGSVVMSKDMFTSISNNAYYRDKEIGGSSFDTKIAEWYKGSASPLTYTLYDSVSAFKTDTGFEANSIDEKGNNVNPNFVHEGSAVTDVKASNYNLVPTSRAKNAGIPLPSDVAAALGWAAGVPVDMGALNNPRMSMYGDTAAPEVTITNPVDGAVVGGIISINASASDNIGVTKVEIIVDNSVVATLDSSPYTTSLDTALLSDGDHTISAKAYDAAGNNKTSSVVNITVENIDITPPEVSLLTPTAGSELKGDVALTASATDNVAIAKVEFFYGSTKIGESTSSPYTINWDTTSLADGNYSLRVEATDTSDNTAMSWMVKVKIKNEKPVDPEPNDSFSVLNSEGIAVAVKLTDQCKDLAGYHANPTIPAALSGKKVVLAFGFESNCPVAGGQVGVSFDLGKSYGSYTNLRVYKSQADGSVKDVTSQADFAESLVDGASRTVISFAVTDGGQNDVDGLTNSKVVDPVFVVDLTSADEGGGTIDPGDNNGSNSGNSGNNTSDKTSAITAPNTGVDSVNNVVYGAAITMISSLLVIVEIKNLSKRRV